MQMYLVKIMHHAPVTREGLKDIVDVIGHIDQSRTKNFGAEFLHRAATANELRRLWSSHVKLIITDFIWVKRSRP